MSPPPIEQPTTLASKIHTHTLLGLLMIGPGQSRSVFKIGGVNLLYRWSQTWLNYSQSLCVCVCARAPMIKEKKVGRFFCPTFPPLPRPATPPHVWLIARKIPLPSCYECRPRLRCRFDEWIGATTTTTRHLQSGRNNSDSFSTDRPALVGNDSGGTVPSKDGTTCTEVG